MRFLLALILSVSISASAFAIEPIEEDKINALLNTLQTSNVTFIRNNNRLTGERAVEHMRIKWKMKKDKVQTAEDFIKHCASKSQQSGKAYIVMFPNGTFMPAAQWLTEKLKDVEAGKIALPPRGNPKAPVVSRKIYDNSDTGSFIYRPTPRKE